MSIDKSCDSAYWHNNRAITMAVTLRIVGAVTVLAFIAALMPDAWFAWTSEQLGQQFPQQPLGFYLARNLSAMYGFVGIGLWMVASDVQRFGPLVPWIARAAIVFGLLQLLLDSWSGLPWWWTVSEGLSTVFGGIALLALCAWCRSGRQFASLETQ